MICRRKGSLSCMSSPDGPFPPDRTVDVLVVDDDSDAVEELVECMVKAGLSCLSAGDGWQALKLLADGRRAKVVVSDLRMPELTGLEFAERLARLGGGDGPEVIFVSGHAGFDDAVEAIRLGARDLLTKPVDGPRLVKAVKSALLARQGRDRATPAVGAETGGLATRKRAALKQMRSLRRMRSQHFPTQLFSDPCWEMLLDLYDGHLAGAEVTVTSLGAASGVPLTTALRRMDQLKAHGLIERTEDIEDKRRTIVRLTQAGLAAVEGFFDTYLQRPPT
ncbi:MAG: response regulator [Reyranella sp.]|nr:MAG: response regulator [Reyranella sp.]TBR25493.1 MAG: response regulator [Reyranella sp.]